MIEYAGPAWYPWLRTTNLKEHERSQHHPLRTVTVFLETTPNEAITIEAKAPTVKNAQRKHASKALRKPSDFRKTTLAKRL